MTCTRLNLGLLTGNLSIMGFQGACQRKTGCSFVQLAGLQGPVLLLLKLAGRLCSAVAKLTKLVNTPVNSVYLTNRDC